MSKIFLTFLELNRSIFSMKCIGVVNLHVGMIVLWFFVILAYLGIVLSYLKGVI